MAQATKFDGIHLIAGEAVLDFVNSVKFRGQESPGDRLGSFQDLCRWCLAAGILSEVEFNKVAGIESKNTLKDAYNLRETLRSFLDNPKDKILCRNLIQLLSRANPKLFLSPKTGRLTYKVEINSSKDIVRRLEHKISDFLEDWQPRKTRSCSGDDCDWVFVDRTKSGRRQWCDSRTCGNRERVRRHRKDRSE